MKAIRYILGALAVSLLALAGVAYAYPKGPVTLVVQYGTGGASDIAARILAREAPEYLGEKILVVNKTGAAGVTGSVVVANGPKDGSQVLMGRVGSQVTVPAMNDTIPYDWDDFTMVGIVELNPFAIAVKADSPYKTYDDLVAALKKGDRKLTYSSSGVGTLLHMGALIALDSMGLGADSHTHVPFKGGGNANAAVVNGNVDFVAANLSSLSGPIESGQLRALVVTTPERVSIIPDVPTAREVGHPGLEAVIGWSGVWGPKGMDKKAVDKWVSVLQQLKTDESWNKATKDLGSIPTILSPDDTYDFIEKQYNAFRKIATKLDIVIK